MPNTLDGWLRFINSPKSKNPPTLLTISGELRNRIYELVLLADEKVYPYDYKPCGCNCPKHDRQAPSTSLLCVNKQINVEATAFMYSSVTFHLPTGYPFMKFMAPGAICIYAMPDLKQVFPSRHLIRSLHLQVLPDFLPSEEHSSRMLEYWADPRFHQASTRERAQTIHDSYHEGCQAVWMSAGNVISHMEGLNVLSLDVEQAFCPNGCCRMVRHVLRSLRDLRKKENFKINVSGELNNEEKIMILKWLGLSKGTTRKSKSNAARGKDDGDVTMSEDYSDMDEGVDEDDDMDIEELASSDEHEESEDLDSDDNNITIAAALHSLRATIRGTSSMLNSHFGSPNLTVNLSVSTVEYPPQ